MRATSLLMKIKCFAVVGLTLCVGLTQASGAVIAVGEAFEGNSWGQAFNETGVGLFDMMAVQQVSGALFEAPVFRSFDQAGWTTTPLSGDTTWATASGPSVTNLNFAMEFTGNQSDSIVFEFAAFRGTDILEAARASWNGGSWSIAAIGNPAWAMAAAQSAAVVDTPEPTSLLAWSLFGLTLGGVTWRRRNRQAI